MRVSIVIPCRDAAAYLAATIESVLAQSVPVAEVIVVDDGSVDGSVGIARRFGERVRVLTQAGAGACAARNRGAGAAAGDALMFLDADDLLGPDAVAGLTAILAPGALAACRWYRLERRGGGWQRRPASCTPRAAGQDPLSAWLEGWYHPPCALLWTRAALAAAGGWDETVTVNDDGLLVMRALAAGVPLIMAPTGWALYRRDPGGTSLSSRRFTRDGLASRRRVLDAVAAALGDRAPAPPFAAALGYAYDLLGADSAAHWPALSRECRSEAGRYGGPAWRRHAHAWSGPLWRRACASLFAHSIATARILSSRNRGVLSAVEPTGRSPG